MTNPSTTELVATRRSLHGVAELLLAGPQHARTGTIRLQVTPGGFGTVREPDLRVRGDRLVGPDGEVGLDGRSPADLGAAVGVRPQPPMGVYSETSGVATTDVLGVDAAAAAFLADVFAVGNEALLALAPQQTPVLWPEHLDVAISLDEVNYGVSPGDGWSDTPYAYVGPWALPSGRFWDAPFGASLPVTETTTVEQVVSFFREGRERAAQAQASASS